MTDEIPLAGMDDKAAQALGRTSALELQVQMALRAFPKDEKLGAALLSCAVTLLRHKPRSMLLKAVSRLYDSL